MGDTLKIGFESEGSVKVIEYSDGKWRDSTGKPAFTAVWLTDKKDPNFTFDDSVVEIAPVVALRFPRWHNIEAASPQVVLTQLERVVIEKDAGNCDTNLENDEAAILAKIFAHMWDWLDRDVEVELIGWAAERVIRENTTCLRMLEVYYDACFDVLKRMSIRSYIPPPPFNLKREGMDKTTIRELAPDDIIETAFQVESRLDSAMERFEYREEQGAMARHVWNAFSGDSHLLIEAGTGIGKTLAYLLPAVLLSNVKKTPIVISTNTINLQEQLLGNDIPTARRALSEVPFAVSLLKGRSHYYCRLRGLEAMYGKGDLSKRLNDLCFECGESVSEAIIRLGFLVAQTETGDMDELALPENALQPHISRMFSAVDCGGGTCLRRKCRFFDNCWFYRARDNAMDSNIVVMNHALLFRLFSAENDETETVLSKVNHFVLDEAHNLEDVITSQFTTELTGQGMIDYTNNLLRIVDHNLLVSALDGNGKTGYDRHSQRENADGEEIDDEGARAALDDARVGRRRLKDLMTKWVELKREFDKWTAACLNTNRSMDLSISNPEPKDAKPVESVLQILEKARDHFAEIARYVKLVTDPVIIERSPVYVDDDSFQTDLMMTVQDTWETQHTLDGLTSDRGDMIRWGKLSASREGVTFRLHVCPLEIGSIFRRFLDSRTSVIMTSATLTAGGDFGFVTSRLGMQGMDGGSLDCVRLYTPFDIANQARVVIPSDIPEPEYSSMEPYYSAISGAVREIVTGFKGGALVLFNSYNDLEEIARRLRKKVPKTLKILCQGKDGTREALAERMRKESGIILFGVRSFWEGFDMPGEALRAVVLTRLPFANFNEPVLKARAAAIRERGGSDFFEYSVPQAAMRFAQGFGRLIRSKTDRGCIFVLDTRIIKKQYGALFIKSLPEHVARVGVGDEIIPASIDWYWNER